MENNKYDGLLLRMRNDWEALTLFNDTYSRVEVARIAEKNLAELDAFLASLSLPRNLTREGYDDIGCFDAYNQGRVLASAKLLQQATTERDDG